MDLTVRCRGAFGWAGTCVLSYDYTVLAGTQGVHGHQKTDRILEICERTMLPVVWFCEGGGGP